jgi:hypothetical protein
MLGLAASWLIAAYRSCRVEERQTEPRLFVELHAGRQRGQVIPALACPRQVSEGPARQVYPVCVNPLRPNSSGGSVAKMPEQVGGSMDNAVERRAARRFSMMLPLKVRFSKNDDLLENQGETRDVSFRGLYFTTEGSLETGTSIEFVLTLPQQITLAGDVHIRCYARVLRVDALDSNRGVAARIDRYEFLPAVS